MTQTQATYRCKCEERQCDLQIEAKGKPVPNAKPPVCPYGKNVAHVLKPPPWELKRQRLKNEEAAV